MSTFEKFSKLVFANYTELSKHELFMVGTDKHVFSSAYLAAFPEGTNPLYKTNTEHDCSCCKNFIHNLGRVVAIIDGKVRTVWDSLDVTAEYPYNLVANTMRQLVLSQPIQGIFRSSETQYGAEYNMQQLEDGSVKRWTHFYGQVAKRHLTNDVGTQVGQYNASVQVFGRGLKELSAAAFDQVLELIEAKALYRGEEHLKSIKEFQALQRAYAKSATPELFIWEHASNPASRFRNTVIGTLIQDLSEGVDLEAAVKSFEAKVAPTNYKRPTALVTPAMVKQAMTTINELGLEPALERRFARISDVTINNVLWADVATKGKMKGGLESLLMGAVLAKPVKDVKAEEITIADFMANVLPGASSIEALVKNAHQGNFMSLTAPVHADSGQLFKWNNNFAWSYDGNIADSLRQRVAAAGGRVDGVLRFSHSWNYEPAMRNGSLMDLHVFIPGSGPHREGMHNTYPTGRRVGWNNRSDGFTGGVQDVDYTSIAPEGYVPVENITFPSMDRLPEGKYTFKIHNWSLRAPTLGGFKAEIEFGGQVFEYEHRPALKNHEWVTVAEAVLKDGKFTIEHKLPSSATSREKWGVHTETFVKVDTLMFSPNYWDDNAVGNKHWFFVLNGCKNPDATRGIYNEFLNSKLEVHRKVFELLASKTKCAPADDQLSGLGFSSTRGDTVTVKVAGPKLHKTFNITF